MLDDLRKADDDDFGDDVFSEEDEDIDVGDETASSPRGTLFLGMTAVERMFIAVFLFLNVLVFGIALLLVTGRIQF